MNSNWNSPHVQNMIQYWFNIASPARPTNFYLALSDQSADPNAGVWEELTVTNYARQSITWTYGGPFYVTNTNQLNFSNLGAGTILGQRIYSAASAGTMLFWADLDTEISFGTGYNVQYPIGIIKIGVNAL